MRLILTNSTANTFAEMAVQEYHAAQQQAGTSIEATVKGLRALVRGVRLRESTVSTEDDCIFVTLVTGQKPVASKVVSRIHRSVHLEHSAAI